jgi:DNA-binding MarR family transcriptional regulator
MPVSVAAEVKVITLHGELIETELIEHSRSITTAQSCQTLNYLEYARRMTDSRARWLSAEEERAWRAFLVAVATLFSAVEGQLTRDSGIPHGYYEILVQLSEAPNRSLRMSQLAEASTSSKSRLSHAVARLEERGWVERLDCKTDRRGQVARLTDAGFAALDAAAPGHVEQVRRSLFDRITATQVAQLAAISAAVAAGEQAKSGFCPDLCDAEPEDPCEAESKHLGEAGLAELAD